MPHVSIIIPAFNAARFLPEAVESALRQTARAHEILVVNDGSTDNTDEIIAPFLNRVAYVKQPNQGVSAARNAGAARASGEWALFLDADDRLDSQALEVLLGSSEGDNLSQVVHGDVINIDEDGQTASRRENPGIEGHPPTTARHLFKYGSIPPSAFAVPLWLVRQLGGFDARFSYAADLHFWMRCACYVPFVHVPETVLYYRVHGSNMSLNHSALRDTIEAKDDFQKWCRQRTLNVLDREYSVAELVSAELQRFYYRRNWQGVRIALLLAQDKGVDNAFIRKIRRLRRLPPWIFACKDKFDLLRQRPRPRHV